jgi:hypothetical protein
MKLGFICLDIPGRINPMTALARMLQARGHDVIFLYARGGGWTGRFTTFRRFRRWRFGVLERSMRASMCFMSWLEIVTELKAKSMFSGSRSSRLGTAVTGRQLL